MSHTSRQDGRPGRRPRYPGQSPAGIIGCTVPFERNPANPTPPEVQHDHRQAQRHHNTATRAGVRFRLPDPPKREPDEMTSYDHLHKLGNAHYLAVHLGNPDTTLVEADRWIVPSPEFNKARARRPDLLIAFDVSPADYQASNGYIVSEQGKPPDFVLEVASESTAEADVGAKRDYYAELGIPEYWRFDETGEFHGTRLAGDRLVNGEYRSMVIEELPGGVLQGYSAALNLNLRWEDGQLVWHDPATRQRIVTLDDERQARLSEQARADNEQQQRIQAEARIQQLEAELDRLRNS